MTICRLDGRSFACRAIYRMIHEEGLGDFYKKRDWNVSGIPEALKDSPVGGLNAPGLELEALLPYIKGDNTTKEADLLIDNIRCASCVWLNEKVLERTHGVLSARIHFATHRLRITWDSTKTTLGSIISRMRSIGYLARPYTPAAQEQGLQQQSRDLLIRLGTAVFFSMQLMILSSACMRGSFRE